MGDGTNEEREREGTRGRKLQKMVIYTFREMRSFCNNKTRTECYAKKSV